MSLTYERDGDGYIVRLREKAICRVHTKTSEFVPARQAPDGRQLPAEVVDKPLAHGDWQFHFYHGFVTPTILKELLDLLPKPEPDHGRGQVFLPGAPAAYPQEKSAAQEAEAREFDRQQGPWPAPPPNPETHPLEADPEFRGQRIVVPVNKVDEPVELRGPVLDLRNLPSNELLGVPASDWKE
jgi:hypothetical protein